MKAFFWAFFSPPMFFLLAIVFGLILFRRRQRYGEVVIVTSVSFLIILSTPVVSGALVRSLEWYPPIGNDDVAKCEVIVVLGGGIYRNAPEYGGETVGYASLERLRYAINLTRSSGLPILATGGAPEGGMPEAEAMRVVAKTDYKVDIRWTEGRSNNTAENALFSAEMLRQFGLKRVALVSHSWHLPRAVMYFRASGLEVVPAPVVFSRRMMSLQELLPSANALADSSRAIREWVGLAIAATG